jgi:glycine/D-amino acid oxidase-like deaminating enzyme
MDFHPTLHNVMLLGAGSGHGFKHGPEVGRQAAMLALGESKVEPRFSLATKSVEHNREVV